MSSTPAISAEQLLAHSAWARSLARRLVADAATADDVVQETWLKALREQPATDRPLRPWLERVLRNSASNARRNRKTRLRHEQTASKSEAMAASVEEVVQKAEGQQRVVAAVLGLPDPYRSVVLLHYYEGMSAADIARRSDTPAGTVRWQLSEGRKLLRNKLDEEAGGDRSAWCAALLPLTGFTSLGEIAETATLTAATTARSSFATILKGVLVMKGAWMVAATAACLALAWLLMESMGGPLMIAPVAEPSGVTAATGDPVPEQVYVRTEAPVVAPDGAPAVATEPGWHATVRMRFVDPLGNGVAAVGVRLGRNNSGESDADGSLTLSVPAPFGNNKKHVGTLLLAARHAQFATVHRSIAAAMLQGDGDAIELGVIELEASARIEGHVVDAAGVPVPFASVSVDGRANAAPRTSSLLMASPVSRDRVGQSSAKTDKFGHFLLDGVLPGKNRVAASLMPEHGWVDEQSGEIKVDASAGATVSVTVPIKRRYTEDDIATIVVLDPDNKPVSRAYVNVQSSRGNSTTYTNKDGVARCGFLNTSREVRATVSVQDNRFARIVRRKAFLGETTTIRFARPVPLPIVIRSSVGRPLAKAQIRLMTVASGGFLGIGGTRSVELSSAEHAIAALDGTVAGVTMPAERFMVEVLADGHKTGTFGPFEVKAAAAGVELELVASAMVRGRVVDASGKAVASAEVSLHRRPERRLTYNGFPAWLDPQALIKTKTDQSGTFELTVREDGMFFVRVTSGGFAPFLSDERDSKIVAESSGEMTVTLTTGGSIRGHVARPDGSNATGAIVAVTCGDGFARTVRTDANGIYRFERMAPGGYHVQRSGREINPGESNWQTSMGRVLQSLPNANCTVKDGEVTTLDLGVRRALDARLTGRIEVGDWQLKGQRIRIEFADVKEGQTSTDGWHAILDAEGKFALPALPSETMLWRMADGTRLIEAELKLVPGANTFALKVDTVAVPLRDLPTPASGDQAGFVVAKWTRGTTTIQLPIEVAADGTATASLPKGKVMLMRAPTESDVGALLARGSFGMLPLRQITVE